MNGSNRPVLDAKPRNLAKVGQILREKQSIVRECDGRDFLIHRPDAQLQTDQPFKLGGSVLIEIEGWTRVPVTKKRVDLA